MVLCFCFVFGDEAKFGSFCLKKKKKNKWLHQVKLVHDLEIRITSLESQQVISKVDEPITLTLSMVTIVGIILIM